MEPTPNAPLLNQQKTGRAAKAKRRNISIALAIVVVTAMGITAVVAASGENKSGRSGAYVSGDPLAWTAVGAGLKSSCGLVNSGQVKCWGDNRYGQLGNGTTNSSSTAVFVSGITTASSISRSANGGQRCASLRDGTVWCWGDNSYGQLGNGTKNTSASTSPVHVSGITTATSIGIGGRQACALLTDSTIWCWGDNTYGQLGNKTNTGSTIPVQVPDITTATSISVSGRNACASLRDGTVWCWGPNTNGQLGNRTNTDSNFPVQVSGITTATSISVSGAHNCAVLTDSTIWCWGDNTYGQLGVNTSPNTTSTSPVQVPGITTASSISAGGAHTCGLLTDSTIWCWGLNSSGQLGDGTSISKNSPVSVQSP